MALDWTDFSWTIKRWFQLYPSTGSNGVPINGNPTASITVTGPTAISGTNTGDQTLASLGALSVTAAAADVNPSGPLIASTLNQQTSRIDDLENNQRAMAMMLLGEGIDVPEEFLD